MTTPGGVTSLPAGALTLDNIASETQDMTPEAMRGRAAARFPTTYNDSTGGNPAVDLTPMGIINRLFAGFLSTVANADPADIQSPDDLPELLNQFIHNLPVVGEFVRLLDALAGTYTGDDQALLQIQALFGGVRGGLDKLRQFIESLIGQALDLLHLPSPEQAWQQIMTTFLNPMSWLSNIPVGAITASTPNLLAGFISADSLVGETMWVFDGAVKPTGEVGSARTVLDGTVHELISERILLDVGRKVDASVKIKYSGVTAPTGSPIRLSWIGWNGDDEVAGGDFAIHQPAGAALDWTTLSGSLTRLETDPWDRVSIVLKTMAGATAGTVWFAAPSAKKPDKLPKSLVDGLEGALAAAGQSIRDAICNALGVGGTGHTDADVINALTHIPQNAVAGMTALANQVGDGFKAWWNHWFDRTDGDGSASQTQQVVEAIRDAVLNGWNVHVVTADETNWPVPTHIDSRVAMFGGGQNGNPGGSNGQATGGAGGLGGSFLAQPIDLTGITNLDFQIGTAGNKSFVRVANTTTPHTGTVVAQSPDHGSQGGIATEFGYTSTTSTPGNGGNGGGYGPASGSVPATDGQSSAVAAGGIHGGTNVAGGDGGSVSAGATTKCGGGGGGGGGGAGNAGQVGKRGGDGGYPGGGGAGGGTGPIVNTGGPRGLGAIGLIVIYTK